MVEVVGEYTAQVVVVGSCRCSWEVVEGVIVGMGCWCWIVLILQPSLCCCAGDGTRTTRLRIYIKNERKKLLARFLCLFAREIQTAFINLQV
jgi:hypothetical protein